MGFSTGELWVLLSEPQEVGETETLYVSSSILHSTASAISSDSLNKMSGREAKIRRDLHQARSSVRRFLNLGRNAEVGRLKQAGIHREVHDVSSGSRPLESGLEFV